MYDSQMGSRHPLRILVAEDDGTTVIIIRTILERLGYQADIAENGREVFTALQTRDYDVILINLEMPHVQGLEAVREIRGLAAERRPRIIGMTAERDEFGKYLEGGIDDYIGKPVQKDDLAAVLSTTPPRGKSGEAPYTQSQPAEPTGPLLLDTAALKRLKETLGSQAEAMFPALLEDFFRDGARLLSAAHSALEKNDLQELRRSAHTLKSNGATFGALRLSMAAKELESLAKQGIINGAEALIKRTQQEFEKAKDVLQTYRKGV
jgi:CheY-like chemotaxis protein